MRIVKKYHVKNKSADVIRFFMNDLCSHYNTRCGFLGGADSHDYNRIFGCDLLDENKKFRQKVLNTPVTMNVKDSIVDISVETQSRKLGLKTDIANRKRLDCFNPEPLFPMIFGLMLMVWKSESLL